MATTNYFLAPLMSLPLLVSAPTAARGENAYDEVRLRCAGTYREQDNPQVDGGHDFELSIMTKREDGEIAIMLIDAIGRLGWFFLDQNGSSNSYRYAMTAKNDMLSGWADASKVEGLIISNLNLDRTSGDLSINSQHDVGGSSYRGTCQAIKNRF